MMGLRCRSSDLASDLSFHASKYFRSVFFTALHRRHGVRRAISLIKHNVTPLPLTTIVCGNCRILLQDLLHLSSVGIVDMSDRRPCLWSIVKILCVTGTVWACAAVHDIRMRFTLRKHHGRSLRTHKPLRKTLCVNLRSTAL